MKRLLLVLLAIAVAAVIVACSTEVKQSDTIDQEVQSGHDD